MKLRPDFTIHNVLSVPNVKCNLILISQLLEFNPKYGVQFFFLKIFRLYKTIL